MSTLKRQHIDTLLEMMSVKENALSDAGLMRSVFCDDMMLDGFEPAEELLKEVLESPIDLVPMIEESVVAIITMQPAISDFVSEGLEKGLFSPIVSAEGRNEVRRSLHHMFLLNELIKKIVEDVDFAARIQNHLLEQRAKLGIPKDFLDALEKLKSIYGGSMFEPTKIIGMDMVYRVRVEDRLFGRMTGKTEKAQIDGLALNILEASITDKAAGFADNALVGAVLASIPPSAVSLTHDESKVMLFHLSRRWVSLYETWNLAFCLGNLAYMSVLLPKLLAPAVIGAPAERYLITRSAGLWCSTLFHQFAVLKNRKNAQVPNAKALASLWGEVNLRYAVELAREEDFHGIEHYESALEITMGEIMERMKDSLAQTPLSDDDRKRLEDIYA